MINGGMYVYWRYCPLFLPFCPLGPSADPFRPHSPNNLLNLLLDSDGVICCCSFSMYLPALDFMYAIPTLSCSVLPVLPSSAFATIYCPNLFSTSGMTTIQQKVF